MISSRSYKVAERSQRHKQVPEENVITCCLTKTQTRSR